MPNISQYLLVPRQDIADHDISTNEAFPDDLTTTVLLTEVKASHLLLYLELAAAEPDRR